MAVVRGVKEKVHLALYDAEKFSSENEIKDQITGNTIKFFVNVQNKTKLETNQQEASVLSHYNTYEARTLRVIIESLNGVDAGAASDNKEFLTNFIYNSVTTFFVGEKIMIQAPTWMFPSGAGEANDTGSTHGLASPEATFRFAEPVHVDSQQNFRVEIEFPHGTDVLGNAQPEALENDPLMVGFSRVWVLVDGYLTRDVQ